MRALRNFIIRLFVNALAIAVVVSVLPGIRAASTDLPNLLLISLIFGLVNALIRPIVRFFTCSLVFLTLGLFVLVINGLMLYLTAALSQGRLEIDNIGWAILGGLIISVIGFVLDRLLGLNEQVKVREVREVRYVVEERRQDLDRRFYGQQGMMPPGAPPPDPFRGQRQPPPPNPYAPNPFVPRPRPLDQRQAPPPPRDTNPFDDQQRRPPTQRPGSPPPPPDYNPFDDPR